MAEGNSVRDNASTAANPAVVETCRVGVRAPPFNPDDPELWFAHIEGQFILSGISADATKFYFVLAQLEPQHTAEVRDLVVSPPATDKYEKLKSELIKRLSASQERKIKQLLMHEELGDRKPTQFLRHLQHLAGVTVPTDFIRTIWASRLPTHLQTCIAAQESKMKLEDLAELADRINDIVPATAQVSGQVASTSTMSHTGPTAATGTTTLDILAKTVAELSRRVETMSMELRQSRPQTRFSGQRSRNHSRSRSRPKDHPLCWYHYRFGNRARKCIQPCTFKKAENSQGSH